MIFILTVTGCTFILQKIDPDFSGTKSNLEFKENLNTYCTENNNFELLSESGANQERFQQFLKEYGVKFQLSFIDKAVIWSLIQMNIRPEQSSPTAKLSIIISDGRNEQYYSFFSGSEDAWPMITGLSQLLKIYHSKHSLKELASILDRYYPDQFFVTKQLEEFLLKYRQQISADAELKAIYMRADDTLRENERLPKQNFTRMVSNGLNPDEKFRTETKLIPFQHSSKARAECNFDLSLYKDNVFLISPEIIRSNVFGLKEARRSFLATTGQKFKKLQVLEGSFFFKGLSSSRTATICIVKNKNQPDQSLWLTSTYSRDPGQHLYHLFEYGVGDVSSAIELDKLIRFSRHLFLKNPLRLIYESDRSMRSQTQELLKLKIPIYSANRLGQIWANFNDEGHVGFITDERTKSALTCGN